MSFPRFALVLLALPCVCEFVPTKDTVLIKQHVDKPGLCDVEHCESNPDTDRHTHTLSLSLTGHCFIDLFSCSVLSFLLLFDIIKDDHCDQHSHLVVPRGR